VGRRAREKEGGKGMHLRFCLRSDKVIKVGLVPKYPVGYSWNDKPGKEVAVHTYL